MFLQDKIETSLKRFFWRVWAPGAI